MRLVMLVEFGELTDFQSKQKKPPINTGYLVVTNKGEKF